MNNKNIKAQLRNREGGIKKMGGIEIIEAGKWFDSMRKDAQSEGNIELASFFNTLRNEMIFIITFLAKKGAEEEIDNYTLPMHGITTALGFDSERFVDDIQDAIEVTSEVKALPGPKQRVEVLQSNPAVRAQMQAYESRRDAYTKSNKLTEFELLFSNKEFEKVRLGTKGIKEHIEYYLRNGKRSELVPYLISKVFAHKPDFDAGEAHNFINRFKEVYEIPEPSDKLKLDVEKDSDGNYKLPSDVWMEVLYSTDPPGSTNPSYKKGYMVRRHGVKANLLFTTDMQSVLISHIRKWRKATVEEVRTEILQKCAFGSAAYKFTTDTYGKRFMVLDIHKKNISK